MTSTSSSFFRSDAQRFEIFIDVPRDAARLDSQLQLTQRLRELLPDPLFPDEVSFKGQMVFLNYSSQIRADEALLALHDIIAFDTSSPIDRALRGARPTTFATSPTNGKQMLFFVNDECVPTHELRTALKRLLGSDNLLLPLAVRSSDTVKDVSDILDFDSREALQRALRIFGQIPAGTGDPSERVFRRAEVAADTGAAYAAADHARGGLVTDGGAATAAASPSSSEQPRSRIFRCELCRDELDEGGFPSSELEDHRAAPRCKLCFARREAEKRRRDEQDTKQQQPRRSSDSAPAGGGAAAAAASSTAVHPCLAQNPAGRCTFPSPCRFGMVRADRCLMWLAGLCGESGDHDGLGHELTATERQTISALQQIQPQQQQSGAQLRSGSGNCPPQQHPPQAHDHDQLVYVPPPPPPPPPAPPHVLPPGHKQRFLANYQQAHQQQPQHEHAGQRREREGYGDDGFAARRYGQF